MLPLIYYFVLVSSLLLIIYLKRSPSTGPTPPLYPGALPLIGHAHLVLGNLEHLWSFISSLHHDCLRLGGVVIWKFSFYNLYVITDPDDIQTIANTCLEKHYAYQFAKSWVGDGLVASDALVWKLHRKLLNPAFNQQLLNGFIGVFNDQARKLVDTLSPEVDNGPFIANKYIVQSIWGSVIKTVLNRTLCQNSVCDKYVECAHEMFDIYTQRFQKIWYHIPFIYRWSASKRKEDKLTRTAINITNSIIKDKKMEVQKKSNSKTDIDDSSDKFSSFLDIILELVKNEPFSDEDLRQELDTLMTAAYDTSATTITYTLIVLGSQADVQHRVFEEIQEVFGNADSDVGKHDFSKLVYLEAVIKETLRLYSVVPLIGRKTSKPVQLKNYILPEGSNCILLFHGLHRHPIWGPDREQFRPERWLDPATLPDHRNAFAGFSVGKRSCIGKVYALMMMKTMLVHVLRRYRVTADVSKLVCKMEVMLKPSRGHEIKLELRDKHLTT